jgi:hypothetical protein
MGLGSMMNISGFGLKAGSSKGTYRLVHGAKERSDSEDILIGDMRFLN